LPSFFQKEAQSSLLRLGSGPDQVGQKTKPTLIMT